MRVTWIMPEATIPDVDDRAQSSSAATVDEESFRAFYDRTARPLWAYLSRMTGKRQLADELLQESYFRLIRAGDVYESESHRRNALFHIATNLVRDTHRRRAGRIDVALDDVHPDFDSDSETRAAARFDVRQALMQLEPRQREILWLAYAQGLSHVEIADVTGASRKSIKSMLYRARQKFAALLHRRGRHD